MQYNENSAHPDYLVLYAARGNDIAGMAGASIDSKNMWQIGIDTSPEYRNAGLASCLVSNLAIMIME